MIRKLSFALALSLLVGCMIGGDEDLDGGEDGDGGPDDLPILASASDPTHLNVGFNDGYVEQFGYYDDYFKTADAIHFGPRLCHTYVQWNVANQAPGAGDVTDSSTRAYLDHWLSKAEGHCDEALISFKSHSHGQAPAASSFQTAFDKFVSTNWKAETGFSGAFSFTPWNEPNNGADDGNGLGTPIDARLAARYYLVAEAACRKHGCKVAAGDFASNGNMWDAFEWNCANDNVAEADLCKTKSSANPSKAPASYLDKYKNEIVNRAVDYGLPKGFKPGYFAYHGWHDANEFLHDGAHCTAYANCALRRILRSLAGAWEGVEIWDTEDGAGQSDAPDDHDQACTAAFMIRLQTITSRVRRMYVTRLHGGGGGLIHDDHSPRLALNIFAKRRTTYDGTCK